MKKEQWVKAKRGLREILREQSVEELERIYKENQVTVAKWELDELFTEKDKLYDLDDYDNSIFPKEKYLKLLPEKIKLINFVADAFEEFRIFWIENSGCSDKDQETQNIIKELIQETQNIIKELIHP